MSEMEFRKRDFLRSICSDYSAVDADALLVNASYQNIVITLPHPSLAARVLVKKVDATIHTVTIVPADPDEEPIDGAASLTLENQHEAYSLICDGESWSILNISVSSMIHVEGASNFAGPGGVTITHSLNLSEYIPDVIPTADAGAVGAIWITDVAVNSFVVRNSGVGVSAFTWSIHKR